MSPQRHAFVLAALAATGCFYDPKVVVTTDTGSTGLSDTTGGLPTSTDDVGTGVCGNNQVDGNEQCDDGNDVAGDGCENDCTTTPGADCGNGMLDPGEECDDGNLVAMDGCENNCTETASSPRCGDGMINGDDECDDGNRDNTDACTNTCENAMCGDSHIQVGVEACDDGDQNSDTAYDGCTPQCELGPRCGDGVVQEAEGEQCDDSTPDGDDLCNNCVTTPYRYIFATSQTFKGDLNKLSGADIKCAAAADSANVPGDANWKAWLSDSIESPASRMDSTFSGWYVLPGPDPLLVARGWAGLTSGTLLNPINRDENGNSIAPGASAWTNAAADGTIFALDGHCSTWDSFNGTGNIGNPNAADGTWTSTGVASDCNTAHHIYCVQN
ncbi:DUF4215 domain-containing protein [Nannocystis sp. SCPEA4]|uniref:DUF4215 domain-containing protein n=1 Tax=Nannocystis sp. SCPEA4 TaxID=2996787 RepID=UPI00226E0B91|nr:DUF4215 domain-containing protein [Nannocystis sp. SCPEA4]MCY1059885.1 DUF4215 domain-containing protein [Nannocystis sp. SCPEA4]